MPITLMPEKYVAPQVDLVDMDLISNTHTNAMEVFFRVSTLLALNVKMSKWKTAEMSKKVANPT